MNTECINTHCLARGNYIASGRNLQQLKRGGANKNKSSMKVLWILKPESSEEFPLVSATDRHKLTGYMKTFFWVFVSIGGGILLGQL